MVSRYNGYFNAKELLKANKKQLEESHKDDFSELIPLFIYPTEEQSKGMFPDMDKIIEKTSTVIDRHSMYIKKKEYNKWIDDSYMLMGKARFYKQEYYVGEEVFMYVAKAFKKDAVKTDALIWLARTHIELGNLNKAESYLVLIDEQGVPTQYNSDFNALYADYLIKKKNIDEAIIRLDKALETTKDKKDKQRYNYVLAQLWLKKKQYNRASDMFTEVIRLKPDYAMMFHAKISKALSFNPEVGDQDDIKKMLSKMAKDGKNKEYLDQIHYALADIAFKQEDEPLGIYHLQQSAALSVSNNKQKALSYLRLGKLFYDKPLYVASKTYYDSCLTVLPKEYENYDKIYSRSQSLTRLVDNIYIVEKEDSLQKVANDPTYRKKLIKELVQAAIEEEERKKENLANGQFNTFNNNTTNNATTNGGGWYFYNATTLGFGFTEFSKNWGTRKLEDDWRRSDRKTIATFDEEEPDGLNANSNDSTKTNKKTTPEYYLQFFPLTPEKMSLSHNKIIEALYALGNIYKEDFQDYKKSISSFETLITRYDTCRYKLPSWYNLYRISLLIEDDAMKQKYEQLILDNYPNSEYARIIQDPSYNKVTRENRKRVDNYYSIVYSMFTDKKFKKVLIRCEKAKSIFADNHLQDHFDMLAALSIGYTEHVDSFELALKEVVEKHPDSEVTPEAQRILNLIKNGVKNTPVTEVEASPYNHVFSSKFHFVAIIPNKDKQINQYKIDISNFNSTSYSSTTFNVNNMFLNPTNQIIIVKSMKDYEAAIGYYKSFKFNQDKLGTLNSKAYTYFLISPQNFITFYKNKDIEGYQQFFEKNFEL